MVDKSEVSIIQTAACGLNAVFNLEGTSLNEMCSMGLNYIRHAAVLSSRAQTFYICILSYC